MSDAGCNAHLVAMLISAVVRVLDPEMALQKLETEAGQSQLDLAITDEDFGPLVS